MKSFLPVIVFALVLSVLTLVLLYCSDVKMKRDEEFWIFSRVGGRVVVHGEDNGTDENTAKKSYVGHDENSAPTPSTGLASVYNKFAAILTILESPWSKNESQVAAAPAKVPDQISISTTHTLTVACAPNRTEEKAGAGKRPTDRGASVFTNDAAHDSKPSKVVFLDDRTTSTTVRPPSLFSFLFPNPESKILRSPPKNDDSRFAPQQGMGSFSSGIKQSMIFPQKQEAGQKYLPKLPPRPIPSAESEESSLPVLVEFEPLFDFPTSFDEMFPREFDPFESSDYEESQIESIGSAQSDYDSSSADQWQYFFRPFQFRRNE
ncbi:Hypothetical protein NTJ_16157 [Nesidiocoris tenuis]|uniref:Uncharacterized protein n=1 Tax=Nesidiocoris tenuis TaxID=355587 RepID=A0ABN7BGB5_9HEMI|nr:Hypothetical protein NTJ_16157 [Nesidiocoris tenuis]